MPKWTPASGYYNGDFSDEVKSAILHLIMAVITIVLLSNALEQMEDVIKWWTLLVIGCCPVFYFLCKMIQSLYARFFG